MLMVVVVFVVIMTLTVGTYLIVQKSFDKGDAAKVRNRLAGKADPAHTKIAETPLFLSDEEKKKDLFGRLLEKLSFDKYVQNLVEQAGMRWAVGQVCIISLLLGLGAFNAIWYLLPSFHVAAFAAAPVAGVAPFLLLRRMRSKRIFKFESQFPDALQFIARAMRAGHAFSVSLEMLHKEFPNPLASEFRRTFEEQNLGLPIDVTLEKLSTRVPLMDVQFFVAAVVLQKRTGGNLAEILDKLSTLIRERFKLRGQSRTISAHGRLSSLVLTAIPSVVGLLMYFVNRDHMLFFTDEYAGQWMAGLALGFQAVGYFIMRQIVKIEV